MKPRSGLRCGIWTRVKGSAVGLQTRRGPRARCLCPGSARCLSVPPRPVGGSSGEDAKVASFKGGSVVQNLAGPGAGPGGTLLGQAKASAHPSGPLGSPPAAQSPQRSPRPGWGAQRCALAAAAWLAGPEGRGVAGRPAGLCAARSRVSARRRASKWTPYVFLLEASWSNSRRIIIATGQERPPSLGKGYND